MKTILILGANSGMAKPLLRHLARPETQLVLADLQPKDLEPLAADLAIRGRCPQPLTLPFDAMAVEQHQALVAQVLEKVGHLDEVYYFTGLMHDQPQAEKDFRLAQAMIMVNYGGAVSILEKIAAVMEKQGRGLIVGISSVAGDRGRQSNYLYGSAKAGLSAYLQGLRNRLARSGVHVLTVKPGMVDTPMTRHLKKGLLYSKPEAIARGILKAAARKQDVAYLPGYWRLIMLVITSVPEKVFKKLKM